MRILYNLTVCLFLSGFAYGQNGGLSTYQFLSLPYSSRVAAFGGKMAASDVSDISLVLQNPAMLDSSLHHSVNLFYTSYFASINFASASFAWRVNSRSTIALSLLGVNYGRFDQADESGIITGTFGGSDLALALTFSYLVDSCFRVGVNLKPVYSHLEQYHSLGFASDIGVHYWSKNSLFAGGITLRNLGVMVKPYTPSTYEKLPLEVVAGISKKLAHAPFRFIVTLQHLERYDLFYNAPVSTNILGNEGNSSPNLVERVGRELVSHLIAGVEFVPVKGFGLRLGYNYQRRNELKVQERVSTVGFSWGVNLRVKKIDVSYSRATYHLTGSTNHFSITTNLNSWL